MTMEAQPRSLGGAPAPDADRTAAIRDAIDLNDPDLGQTFGERARLEVLTLIERLLAETRAGDLGECAVLLTHVRERLAPLDPRALQPAAGIAGWFDSRGRRLKRFRADFLEAMHGVSDTVGDIVDRGGGLDRRETALEQLWTETRTAISELDAYIAAGQARLTEPVAAPEASDRAAENDVAGDADSPQVPAEGAPELEPGSAFGGFRLAPTPEPEPQLPSAHEPADARPSPPVLETRVAALIAVRDTAVRQLPLVRLAQNADCRLPDRLKGMGEAATRWRTEWSDALGLTARRPRKIKPDQAWLAREREALSGAIEAIDAEIAAARARRSEVEGRKTRVAEHVRRAA